jgi:hypothetical protein
MAAVLFSDRGAPEVEDARRWSGLAALASARALDLEVVAFSRVGRRGWGRALPRELDAAALDLPPWPVDSARAGAARLAWRALRGPRAARPRAVLGLDALGAEVAARVGRVLGVPAVGWLFGAERAPPPGLDDVWSADDAVARGLVAAGVRAFRATLVPPADAHGPAGLGPAPVGRLLAVGGADSEAAATVLEGIERVGGEAEARALASAGWGWPAAMPRIPDARVEDRTSALRNAGAVLALEPEGVEGLLVEALLAGRPVLVPARRRMPFVGRDSGAVFDPARAESVADALAEVWSGLERGRLHPSGLRAAGRREALDARVDAWVDRLLSLV